MVENKNELHLRNELQKLQVKFNNLTKLSKTVST